ncbi:MAG: DUF3795 domain-containing protein [Chloroflexota bacterium]|nr:DUF3795 domain-containing protein [Chloroflexota bacterium]
MKDIFAPCGINCGHCPSYRDNLLTNDDRQRCSDGWYKYHGFRLSPAKLVCCDGCPVPVEENPVRYFKRGCNVRKCAVFNGIESCARCSAYLCEDVQRYFTWADDREKHIAQLEAPLPEEDHFFFIEAFDHRKHLDAIRASLALEDIVEMKAVSTKPRLVAFPDDLPFTEKEMVGFEALHRLIGAIDAVDGVSYARQLVLKKRRRDLLKILWGFGRFGELEEEDGAHLVMDSETYLAQKIHSGYSTVKDYFKVLGEHGVHCEHVPLVEQGWLTPTGALRKGGWFIKMSFGDDAEGVSALKALQSYTARLDKEHGKGAFRYFSKADMRVLRQLSTARE